MECLSLLVFVCDCAKCVSVSVSVCLFARALPFVLTYANPDARRLTLEMLVSSVVVLAPDYSPWTRFPAGSPQKSANGFAQG